MNQSVGTTTTLCILSVSDHPMNTTNVGHVLWSNLFYQNHSALGEARRKVILSPYCSGMGPHFLVTALSRRTRLPIIISSSLSSYHLGLVDSAPHANAGTSGLMRSSLHGVGRLSPKAGNDYPFLLTVSRTGQYHESYAVKNWLRHHSYINPRGRT